MFVNQFYIELDTILHFKLGKILFLKKCFIWTLLRLAPECIKFLPPSVAVLIAHVVTTMQLAMLFTAVLVQVLGQVQVHFKY